MFKNLFGGCKVAPLGGVDGISVLLFPKEIAFHDSQALHLNVEFHAWDHEMTCCLPASVGAFPSIVAKGECLSV